MQINHFLPRSRMEAGSSEGSFACLKENEAKVWTGEFHPCFYCEISECPHPKNMAADIWGARSSIAENHDLNQ